MGKSNNWHESVFFGIHYDLHASADDTELGKKISYEHIKERLLRVKPDWIQWDCKGHPGYTSWPTEIGSTSPGVVNDMLRVVRDVTKELGIKLGMHYSGVYDTRAIELHPEWARIDETGKLDANYTCRLSSYVDELMIPQMIEVIDKYDVDGFWVDGENWAALPCWCERCQKEFFKRTGIKNVPYKEGDAYWDEWLRFQREIFVEYVTKYANAVHERKPECLICSNWMYTVCQPDPISAPVDYISGDYSWIWGADRAAIEGRVIDSRGVTWDLMCWSFCKSGDRMTDESYPWTMKTPIHLKQEVSEVLALGGAIMLYNVPLRTGLLVDWHQDLIGEIAEFSRKRKDVCFRTESASQVAVLHVAEHYYANNVPLFNLGQSTNPIEGALHVLLQNQISTDVLIDANLPEKIGQYKLIVIPEQTRIDNALFDVLTKFAENGGHVLISGAHLTEECSEFVGANKIREITIKHPRLKGIYLPVDGKAVPAAGQWVSVSPVDKQTEILTCWLDGQEVVSNMTDEAVVTRRKIGNGAITAIYGPIFEDYFHGHYPLLRRYVKGLIDSMNIDWRVQAEGPSQLEVVLRRKDEQLLINLLNRGADVMTNERQPIIESLPEIKNVVVKIKSDCKPQSVKLLPNNIELDYDFDGYVIVVKIPEIKIHDIVAIS